MLAMGFSTSSMVMLSAEVALGLVSISANGLVLLALCKYRALWNTTNVFIGSLALSDLLVSIVVAPTAVTSNLGLPRHFRGCIFINCLAVVLTNIAILNILAVSLERFAAIRFPVVHRKVMSRRLAVLCAGVTWVVGALLGLAPVMGWHESRENFAGFCSFAAVIPLTFMVYLIFLGMMVPCCVAILLMYVSIFLILRERLPVSKTVTPAGASRSENHAANVKRLRRSVRAIVLVYIVFLVCWLPLGISNTFAVMFKTFTPIDIVLVFVVLSHATSAINPYIYALFIRSIRMHIKHMLGSTILVEEKIVKSSNAKLADKAAVRALDNSPMTTAFGGQEERSLDKNLQTLTSTRLATQRKENYNQVDETKNCINISMTRETMLETQQHKSCTATVTPELLK